MGGCRIRRCRRPRHQRAHRGDPQRDPPPCRNSNGRALTIGDWLDDWLAGKEQVSAATRVAYDQTVREFKAFLGEQGCKRRLETIGEADIRGFVALLRSEGRSAGTINKIVRKHLSIPFEKARKLGKIRFNPVMLLDPEKVESVSKHTFTPDQVASLVAIADRDWSGAILFAYGTGARLQDVANLRWSSLDPEAGVVSFVERKTGRKARHWSARRLHRLDRRAIGPRRPGRLCLPDPGQSKHLGPTRALKVV